MEKREDVEALGVRFVGFHAARKPVRLDAARNEFPGVHSQLLHQNVPQVKEHRRVTTNGDGGEGAIEQSTGRTPFRAVGQGDETGSVGVVRRKVFVAAIPELPVLADEHFPEQQRIGDEEAMVPGLKRVDEAQQRSMLENQVAIDFVKQSNFVGRRAVLQGHGAGNNR